MTHSYVEKLRSAASVLQINVVFWRVSAHMKMDCKSKTYADMDCWWHCAFL